jgi:hypothetical protein
MESESESKPKKPKVKRPATLKDPKRLTTQQDLYCRLLALGNLTQKDAYIEVFGQRNATIKSISEKASQTARMPKIQARVKELKDKMIEKLIWSKVAMVTDLKEISDECKQQSEILVDANGNTLIKADVKARGVAVNAIKTASEIMGYKSSDNTVNVKISIVGDENGDYRD